MLLRRASTEASRLDSYYQSVMNIGKALSTTVALIAFSAVALADIAVQYNGNYLRFPDAKPTMTGGRVLVPLRAVLEGMGIDVKFDPATNVITASQDETVVKLRLGDREATVNDRLVLLDVPAQAVKGRTFVPLRFFGEAFGAEVRWRAADETVLITRDEVITSPIPGDVTGLPQATALTHTGSGWMRSGEQITFALKASPKQPATLYLNEGQIQIKFTETTPGNYTASYTVPDAGVQRVSFEDEDAFAVVGMNSQRVAIRTTQSLKVDNTKPNIVNFEPTRLQKLVQKRPVITAELQDMNGSGVDRSSVRLWVDGKDMTSSAYVTDKLILLKPDSDLSEGMHNVKLTVADMAGNISTVETDFDVVYATNLVQSFTLDSPSMVEPGDRIQMSAKVDSTMRRAWVKFGQQGTLRQMVGDPGSTMTATYTVAKGDAFDETPIIVVMENARGERLEYATDKTITMVGASTPKPVVTSPVADSTLGDSLVVKGTASNAKTVRVKVEYSSSLLGLLETSGLVREVELEVKEDGTFATDAIQLKGVLGSKADNYRVTVTAISAKGRESTPVVMNYKGK